MNELTMPEKRKIALELLEANLNHPFLRQKISIKKETYPHALNFTNLGSTEKQQKEGFEMLLEITSPSGNSVLTNKSFGDSEHEAEDAGFAWFIKTISEYAIKGIVSEENESQIKLCGSE